MAFVERFFGKEHNVSKKYTPTLEQAREFAHAGYKIIPIYQTLPADLETPGRIYLKLTHKRARKQWRPSFLFESVEVGEKLGRYSYVGINPKMGIEVLSDGGWIERTIKDSQLHDPDLLIDPLEILESRMPRKDAVAPVPGLPPFFGGFVGYLGYECIKRWEPKVPIHPNTLGIPDSIFFEAGDLVVYDHIQQRMKVLTNIEVGDGESVDKSYYEAQRRIEDITKTLRKRLRKSIERPVPKRRRKQEEVVSNFTREEYMDAVEKLKEHIFAGDTFQVVSSQRLSKQTSADPYTIYRAYRQGNPSPYMFYINFTDHSKRGSQAFQLIGTSPEISIKLEGNTITSRPLAGTRPRGFKTNTDGSVDFETIDPEKDNALEEDMRNDGKERAEHVMLVDLARNDVGRVAKFGTERVNYLMEVERYSRVMHMSSEIQAELDDDKTCFDLVRATFPVGTVSGAPKVEAMKEIYEVEPARRGPYSGATGFFALNGDVTLAINIRTAVKIGDTINLQAGGGIVADSDPEEEYKESMRKASAGLVAIDRAETEEL